MSLDVEGVLELAKDDLEEAGKELLKGLVDGEDEVLVELLGRVQSRYFYWVARGRDDKVAIARDQLKSVAGIKHMDVSDTGWAALDKAGKILKGVATGLTKAAIKALAGGLIG